MGWFLQFWAWLFKDQRSDWEQKQERRFITAVNPLKNYSVSDRGGLSMDPEELRERIIVSREELKHLVPRPLAHHSTRPVYAFEFQEAYSNSDVLAKLRWG